MDKQLVLPDDLNEASAAEILNRARDILALPPDATLRVENIIQTQRGTRILFSYTSSVELGGEELREAAGVRVEVRSRGDLRFNRKGDLVRYEVQPADPRQIKAIRDNLSKLLANDQVYVARPGEKVDPAQLAARGKVWYVEEDEAGNKVLRRAFIS